MGAIEEFEVCTFCGEFFKGEKIKDYQAHRERCRDEYNADNELKKLAQHYYDDYELACGDRD